MSGPPILRHKSDETTPTRSLWRASGSRFLLPAALMLGLAVFFWSTPQLRSDNFIFYFPSGCHIVPIVSMGNIRYLPLMQILNMVGKVGGIQEKKNSIRIWFGNTQIELKSNDPKITYAKEPYDLPQPVRLSEGQWLVPVEFLTTILPRLTHQPVEYQEGTSRIFIGDVKPASFTARLDPIPNGARLTVQFTDKVAVRTASSNGKWIMFLGDRPMEPLEPSYRFHNPYLSELQYDDQDGVPKLVISPTSGGLNFYPMQAEGGKILLADVLKPPSLVGQAAQPAPPTPAAPATTQPPSAGPTPQAAEESPAAPLGPPLPVVTLDAGHGGADNGGHSRDGVLEKDLVSQYVARVRAALLATNKYRVVLSRAGDVSASSEQRALAANLSGAICFLSIHAGDLGPTSPRITVYSYQPSAAVLPVAATGTEPPTGAPPVAPPPVEKPPIFVPWEQTQEMWLEQSAQFAQAVQQQFALLNGVEVEPPTTAPIRTLRNVNAPAVAIELGRLATDEDATALTNPVFQQQVAGAIVEALAAFQKGGVKP